MDNADIKLIAEELLGDMTIDNFSVNYDGNILIIKNGLSEVFKPDKSWEDCGLVLEDGIKRFGYTRFLDAFEKFMRGEMDLKQAICQAYLTLIKGE